MTILPAGTFRVSDYRKAITTAAKISAVLDAIFSHVVDIAGADAIEDLRGAEIKAREYAKAAMDGTLRFDHRPPLQDRDYDLEKGDFVPPQNDPNYIEAIQTKVHDERTFGRREGAERTVTTANSDAGRRKHIRDVQTTEARHELKMACKRGDPVAIAKLLHVEKPKRPKRKIPSRPFPNRTRRAV